MHKLVSASILSLGLLAPTALFAAEPASADKAAAAFDVDKASFVKVVTSANAFEIESSKLAEQKARDADVKEFAKQMIADHTKAAGDFKAALGQGQTTASIKPSGPGLQPREQQQLAALKSASGKDFDGKYIRMQLDAHKDAVALFSTYANSGDDPAMKEFAKKTLPVLKMHEKHAKELAVAHQD